jgi:hypothetical protein
MDWRKLLALRERFLPAQGADSGFSVDRVVQNDETAPHWSLLVATLENSPSKAAAADQPFSRFISTDAVTRKSSRAFGREYQIEGNRNLVRFDFGQHVIFLGVKLV